MTEPDVREIVRASGDLIRRRLEGDDRPRIGHLDPDGAPHSPRTCPVCQDRWLGLQDAPNEIPFQFTL